MTILRVKEAGNNQLTVEFPERGHNPYTAEQIKEMLQRVSPGYVEYVLQTSTDPHCSACRDMDCENQGGGDDACAAFKFGEEW